MITQLQAKKNWLVFFSFFILTLFIRTTKLGTFQTADELKWIGRTNHFLAGLLIADHPCPLTEAGRLVVERGWACTLQSSHPGITTMWLAGGGMLLYYWQNIEGVDLHTFLIELDRTNVDLLAPMQLPFAVTAALFFPLFYLLLRRLVTERIAIFTTLLLVMHPFVISHARVIHHDNLNTMFMSLSLLTMIGYWFRDWRWPWLVVSGLLAGLAILSKPIGMVMLPCAALLGGVNLLNNRRWQLEDWGRLIGQGSLWGGGVALSFALFLPAIWVSPERVFQVIFWGNTELALDGHSQYLLGEVSLNPGILFYPVVWFVRSSPFEVVGLLGLVGVAYSTLREKHGSDCITYFTFVIFLGLVLLVLSISPKKQGRYLLVIYPIMTVFIVIGLLWLWDRLYTMRGKNFVLVSLILLTHGWLIWTHAPYYLTYYNPFLGGATGAAKFVTIGWGEGLSDAAAYLNHQPNAENLQVAVPRNTEPFRSFFTGITLNDSPQNFLRADYIVYYYNFIQRLDNFDSDGPILHYTLDNYDLVHEVVLNGFPYAKIYYNFEPLQHLIHQNDNHLADRSRILGYNFKPSGESSLFWQNLVPDQSLWAGLASVKEEADIEWVACVSAAGEITGVIQISRCPLARLQPPQGDYELHFGLQKNNGSIDLVNPESVGIIAVDVEQKFHWLSSSAALAQLGQDLVRKVNPLNIDFGYQLRLVGYLFQPEFWQSAEENDVVLYWQLLRPPDFQLAQAYQIVLRLTRPGAEGSIFTAVHPLIAEAGTFQSLEQGVVIPVHYAVTLPNINTTDNDFDLEICLAGIDARLFKCFVLPVMIAD